MVTTGAAGIGRAIAEASLEAEAQVYVCDVSQQAIDAFVQAHPEAGASLTDVADESAVDRLFDEASRPSPGSMSWSTMPGVPAPPAESTRSAPMSGAAPSKSI